MPPRNTRRRKSAAAVAAVATTKQEKRKAIVEKGEPPHKKRVLTVQSGDETTTKTTDSPPPPDVQPLDRAVFSSTLEQEDQEQEGNISSQGSSSRSKVRQTTILDQYPNLLADLLSPSQLSVQEFLRTKFRQQAYHIPAVSETQSTKPKNNTPKNKKSHSNKNSSNNNNQHATTHPRMARIVETLFDLDPQQVLEQTASENIFVWLKEQQRQEQHEHQQQPSSSSSCSSSSSSSSSLIRSIEVSDSETALALYRAGHSTYCRAPTELEEVLVPALLQNTGLGCGQYYPATGGGGGGGGIDSASFLGRGEVEIFLSAQVGQVTGWHYDFQENFTLQLSGRKQWTLQHSTVRHPLSRAVTPQYQAEAVVEGQLLAARLASSFGSTTESSSSSSLSNPPVQPKLFQFGPPPTNGNHPNSGYSSRESSKHHDNHHNDKNNNDHNNSRGPVEQVILEPGDVLYFPAGMWHKVQVLEPGVSLNISLMATNYASLACRSLEHYLLQRSAQWRQTILSHHYDEPNNIMGATRVLAEPSTSSSQPPRQRVQGQTQGDSDDNPDKNDDDNDKNDNDKNATSHVASRSRSAVEQLQDLLEYDLPLALHDWIHNHGGASAILPPILRQGRIPYHETAMHDNDNDDDKKNHTIETISNADNTQENGSDHEMNEDDEVDDVDEESEVHLQSLEEDDDDDDDDDDDKENDEQENIIHIDESPPPSSIGFDPSPYALKQKLKTHRLIRNPLAMLIRGEDITRYYHGIRSSKSKKGGGRQEDDDDQEKEEMDQTIIINKRESPTLFVLNFNFAGNELAQESLVRATFSTRTHKYLDTVFLGESSADEQTTSLIQSAKDENCNAVAWLIYLGYLVWVERRR